MKTMRLKAIGLVVLLAAAVAGAGCNLEPSVPGQPGYEADITPILEARCNRCHTYPQIGGAFPTSRLDVYQCPAPDGTPCMAGAIDRAGIMAAYVQLPRDAFGHMPPPPAASLSPYQIDTIVKWSKQNPPSP
jgi:hypothetical protein